MLYEPRVLTGAMPGSERYEKCRQLFVAGRATEAKEKATVFRKQSLQPETAEDYLLCIEISRACGNYARSQATIHLGLESFPDDPRLLIYGARSASARGRILRGLRLLEARRDQLEAALPGQYWSEIASLYAQCEMEQSARDSAKKALDVASDDAVTLYTLSCGASYLRDWNEAIDLAQKALAIAPSWMRCRSVLVDNLLSCGDREREARAVLDEGRALDLQDNSFEIQSAVTAFALGESERAQSELLAFLEQYPKSDVTPIAQRILFALKTEAGDWDGALELLDGIERKQRGRADEEFEKLKQRVRQANERSTAKHRLIRAPVMAQRPDQCVSTSVAIACAPQNVSLDANQLYQEMKGRAGVMLWRMRERMESLGFRVACVQATSDCIRHFIDADVPLIGVIELPFNSHVEVVCGYDDRLESLWIRDPSSFFPYTISYEDGNKRWDLHGNSLWAIIAPDRISKVEVPEKWHASEGDDLEHLLQGVVEGKHDDARDAFDRISDDSPAAFLRDMTAANVFVTGKHLTELMTETAKDTKADPVLRFRAFQRVQSPEIAAQIEEMVRAERKTFGVFVCGFTALTRYMLESRWDEALSCVDELLEYSAPVTDLWEKRAQILVELGRREEAVEALDFALQMAPKSSAIREQRGRLEYWQRTFEQRVEDARAVAQDDADNHGSKYALAAVLSEGPDGLEYEKAMLDYISLCPRDVRAQQQLAAWYAGQDRYDLARSRLEEARSLTSLDEIPKWDFELEGSDAPVDLTPFSAPPEKLPEDKAELLEIVAQVSNDLFARAVERLVQLDQDGKLTLQESAFLLGQRVNHILSDSQGDAADGEAIAQILPATPRGSAPSFVAIVCETIQLTYLPFGALERLRRWMKELTGSLEAFPDLRFTEIYLQELAGKAEDAANAYKALVESHPGLDSAWYRMGIVRWSQGALAESEQCFQEALKINPGLFGALEALLGLQHAQNDVEGIMETRELLLRRFPYNRHYLVDQAFDIGTAQNWDKARDRVQLAETVHPPAALQLIEARILLREGRESEVPPVIDRVKPQVEEYGIDDIYTHTRLEFALASKNDELALEICESGIERWPESSLLHQVKREVLFRTDPERAEAEARKRILEGSADHEELKEYLLIDEYGGVDRAKRLIAQVKDGRRDKLALQLNQLYAIPELFVPAQQYMKWAQEEFPHLLDVQESASRMLAASGKHKKAVAIAETLLKADPENPRWLNLMGLTLQGKKPDEAIEYLRRSHQISESADTHCQIARCEVALGRNEDAARTYGELLDRSPLNTAAIADLFRLDPKHPKLWAWARNAAKAALGSQDAGFHVAVVRLARERGEVVPTEWLGGAFTRRQILLAQGGARGEAADLKMFICAWLTKWDERELRREYGGFINGWICRFWWPGLAWVPERDS